MSGSSATSEKSLTVHVEVHCVLGIFNAVHDLAAIGACVTGAKLDHRQRGIAHVLGVTGHRYAVPVDGANLDHPILGHQHCGFDVSLDLGPFDPQVISAINGSVGTYDRWRRRDDGEEARKVYLPREGPCDWSDYR